MPHPSDAQTSVVVGEGLRVNVFAPVPVAVLLPVVVALGVVEGDAPVDREALDVTLVEEVELPLTVAAGVPVTDELTVCVELRDAVDVAVCVGLPVTLEVTVAAAVPVADWLTVAVALGVVEGDAPRDKVALAVTVGLIVTDDVGVRVEVELTVRAGLPDAVDVGEDEHRHVSTLASSRKRSLASAMRRAYGTSPEVTSGS